MLKSKIISGEKLKTNESEPEQEPEPGDDIIYGGDGDDIIYGGNGDNIIYGEQESEPEPDSESELEVIPYLLNNYSGNENIDRVIKMRLMSALSKYISANMEKCYLKPEVKPEIELEVKPEIEPEPERSEILIMGNLIKIQEIKNKK